MLNLRFLKNKDINRKKKKKKYFDKMLFSVFIYLFIYFCRITRRFQGHYVYINRRCITGVHNIREYV